MAVVVQYEFNNKNDWENAGAPKLVETATEIIVLGRRIDPETKNPVGKYYVEVLFANLDDVPENGLLAAKAVDPIPHQFIGYPNLSEFEEPLTVTKK